jgi:opacity protein-like surface antigen
VVATAATAAAQDQTATQGNYFQIDLGSGVGGNAHLSGTLTGVGSASGDIHVQPGFFGSGAVGHSFGNGLALEGEGYYAHNQGETSNLGFSSNVESYGALANLMYAITRIGPVAPYVGGGAGWGHIGYGAFGGSVGDSGLVWQLRAGVSGHVTRAIKWDIGYRYFTEPTFSVSGTAGKFEIKTHLHVLTFGVRERF